MAFSSTSKLLHHSLSKQGSYLAIFCRCFESCWDLHLLWDSCQNGHTPPCPGWHIPAWSLVLDKQMSSNKKMLNCKCLVWPPEVSVTVSSEWDQSLWECLAACSKINANIRYKDLRCSITHNVCLECLELESLTKALVSPVSFPIKNILWAFLLCWWFWMCCCFEQRTQALR